MQADTFTTSLFTRLANSTLGFSQRYGRFVVIAMLLLLHVAALRGVSDNWARALLLTHLGLILLWQPFLRGEHQVSAMQLAFIAFGATAVMLWLRGCWCFGYACSQD